MEGHLNCVLRPSSPMACAMNKGVYGDIGSVHAEHFSFSLEIQCRLTLERHEIHGRKTLKFMFLFLLLGHIILFVLQTFPQTYCVRD